MASYIFLQHNLGGLLEKVRGEKSYGYDYITKIGYDKFEQRTYLKYCNGAETFYSYDPQHRRLENLVVNAKAGTIMDNAYSYDAVSNVLSVKNNAPLPQSGKAGGQMSHSYTYDPLYRLSSATNSIGGYPRFYRKCQEAIDSLDSYLTPFARQKRLGHYCPLGASQRSTSSELSSFARIYPRGISQTRFGWRPSYVTSVSTPVRWWSCW